MQESSNYFTLLKTEKAHQNQFHLLSTNFCTKLVLTLSKAKKSVRS